MLKLRHWPKSQNFGNYFVQIIDSNNKIAFNGYMTSDEVSQFQWFLKDANLDCDMLAMTPLDSRSNCRTELSNWLCSNKWVEYKHLDMFVSTIKLSLKK